MKCCGPVKSRKQEKKVVIDFARKLENDGQLHIRSIVAAWSTLWNDMRTFLLETRLVFLCLLFVM